MNFFGDMFDFDGDGETSLEEEVLGLMMVNECFHEEEDRDNTEEDD